METMAGLETSLAGVSLVTPLVAAAGTTGTLAELPAVAGVAGLGALTTKSITPEPRAGNRPIRLVEVSGGMLNSVGLANPGLERFAIDALPAAQSLSIRVFGSVAGHSIDDYIAVAHAMDGADGLDLIELNLSCPNSATGLDFGGRPAELKTLMKEVRPFVKSKPLSVKLSGAGPDVVGLAVAAIESGADVLTLMNTIPGMSIDVKTRRSNIGAGRGGVSGPLVHPVAVRCVSDVYRAVAREAGVPIIGVGGVLNWTDAAEFILAGATAVGIGTGMMINPRLPKRISKKLSRWVERQGCQRVDELIGAFEP
jgi:dihydroorotate dehydrogenase (NAD+) catalytic subunit